MTKLDKKTLHLVHTLETTSDCFINKNHERQYYKGIRKHKTIQKVLSIIDIPNITTKDKNKYWNTYHCNSVLLQDGAKFTGSLCRKRWCTECCRIKTAEMTNSYKAPLMDLGNLYFVTLTRPNVKGQHLKKEVQSMIKCFQRIKDNLRKNYDIKISGMRKIEVTYNEKENTYHPHFHLIQDNFYHAEMVQKLWMDSNLTANIKGQDIRVIDTKNDNSFIELFKYATKEATDKGQQYPGEVLHTIYKSLTSIRIYQTYGSIKKVKAPFTSTTETTEINHVEATQEIWIYEHDKIDYTNSFNELLINTLTIKDKIKTKKLTQLQYEN